MRPMRHHIMLTCFAGTALLVQTNLQMRDNYAVGAIITFTVGCWVMQRWPVAC